jgi:hypothetical protein
MLERTARFLASRQGSDGAWRFAAGCFHEPFTGGDNSDLAVTAYVTWALAGLDPSAPAATKGAAYVARNLDRAGDAFTIALCANALLTQDSHSAAGLSALGHLGNLRRTNGKDLAWWDDDANDVSATALAVLAMARAGRGESQALAWLAQRRDSYGTWGSTTPTVLALRALLAGTRVPVARTETAKIAATLVALDGAEADLGSLVIEPGASDVVHSLRLDAPSKPGRHRIRLRSAGAKGMSVQLAAQYHSPARPKADSAGVSVSVDYDRTELRRGQSVTVEAIVRNTTAKTAEMLIVDVGVPPGFSIDTGMLDGLVGGDISRYAVTARGVIVYVRKLEAGASLPITFQIRARMALRAAARASEVYSYYSPENRAAATGARFIVE